METLQKFDEILGREPVGKHNTTWIKTRDVFISNNADSIAGLFPGRAGISQTVIETVSALNRRGIKTKQDLINCDLPNLKKDGKKSMSNKFGPKYLEIALVLQAVAREEIEDGETLNNFQG